MSPSKIHNRAARGLYTTYNPPCKGCNCPYDVKWGYKPCPILDKDLIEQEIQYDKSNQKSN